MSVGLHSELSSASCSQWVGHIYGGLNSVLFSMTPLDVPCCPSRQPEPTPRLFVRTLRLGKMRARAPYIVQATVPGTANRPGHPPSPFPFGMLILIQEFPSLPRVPRPSRPCRVTSAARHLVVITRLPVERGVTVGPACAASLGSGWLVHVL